MELNLNRAKAIQLEAFNRQMDLIESGKSWRDSEIMVDQEFGEILARADDFVFQSWVSSILGERIARMMEGYWRWVIMISIGIALGSFVGWLAR